MTKEYVTNRNTLATRLGIEKDRNAQLGDLSTGFGVAGVGFTLFELGVAMSALVSAPAAIGIGVVGFFVIGVTGFAVGTAKSRSDDRLRALNQSLFDRHRLLNKMTRIGRIRDPRRQQEAWQQFEKDNPEFVAMVKVAAIGLELDRLTGSRRGRGSRGGGFGHSSIGGSYGVSNGSYVIGIGNDYVAPRQGSGGGGFWDDYLKGQALA